MSRPAHALAALVFLTAPALAQPVQSLARVKVGSASVYSGPGEQMPRCGTVEQGHIVVVDHPEGGDWLAIQPPDRGLSLSWISSANVELQGSADKASITSVTNALVRSDGVVKLAVGQVGLGKPLNVQRTNIPEGTVVKVIGPKVRATADGDSVECFWYPIVPPRDDFRFVRRADVEMIGGAEKPGFVVKQAAHTEPAGELPVASVPGAGAGQPSPIFNAGDGTNNPLWRDAEKARDAGNFPLAEQLYKKVAEDATKGGDTALANLCFSRIHALREQQRQRDRGDAPALKPLPLDQPAVVAKPPAAATVGGSGELRIVDFRFEGKPVYALTDKRGVSLYLVSDDINLKPYNRRWVELSGPVSYPKEFAGVGLMRVASVDKVEGK